MTTRPARRGRLASWVRAACLLLCVALLLQPSAIVAGRGASRPNAPAISHDRSPSLTVVTAHTLLYVAKGLVGGLRSLASALAADRHTAHGFNALAAGAASSSLSAEPVAAIVLLGSPTLSVVTTSDSQVSLSWTSVSGAATYRVERTANLLTPYAQIIETASTSYNDAAVSRGNTYLYRVRAVDGNGVQSSPSAVVMATAVTFTDETLYAAGDPNHPATVVKWQHVNDLRTAVTGVRRAALLPDPSWTYSVAHGVPVHAKDVQELRDRLNEGLAALGLPTIAFYEPTLHTGENGSTPTPIRKIHFDELRTGARSGSGVTGSGLTAYDFATARLDASNRTGEPGVDLVSRNFNWGLPLASLLGRSGLDLGLSLSYNSLVWTKSGNYVLFDGDWGTPSPGFRLGFPVVQGKFYDTQAGAYAYMMVTPSGARVSLRQTATGSTFYEAGDSSHLYLSENADNSLTVTTTGGTAMTYMIEGTAFKCTKVEDSNGNYITAAYDAYGNLSKITDTLGRELDFSYPDGYLKEITQVWHREVESGGTTQVVTETHKWARFTYADVTVRTSFPGLTVFGPANNQTFHALTEVQLADDSAYTFGYTTWGQVNKIATLAPDGRTLNYVSLNLPADDSQAQTDCPRFTESHVWAAYWNGDADGSPATAEEAVTSYGTYNFAGGVAHADAPDGTRHQETYVTSGWEKGITTRADEFSSDDYQHPKKTTTPEWHQDDDTLTYAQNPRVTRTDLYDYDPGGAQLNHRRTDVAYAAFGLVQDVTEYDSLAANEVRRTHTDYLPSSVNAGGAYLKKRIIGLPSEVDVYGVEAGRETLASKLTYDYDLTGEYMTDAGAVVQHDSLFGTAVTARGNVCRVSRWDAQYPQDQSKSVTAEAGYNTLGSAVFSRDALLHKTTVDYTDSFAGTNSEAVAGAKLAYPTKVTDPDTFFSTVEYNYDTGLPTKATDPKGAAVKSFYDAAGRRLKARSEVNGAYTRWEYEASGLYAKQYTQVDTDKLETFVVSVMDGAGRVRGALRELPSSTGGAYSAQRFEYDRVGQQVKVYNPTEVTVGTDISDIGGWQPTGDDSTTNGGAGWTAFVTREYDWKGRLRHEVSQDGVTDRYVDYTGCGCAGGAVVTTKGELVPVPGTTGTARRVQKVHSDSLGREWKTEVYNWDGATVYSTTTVKYDALDHVVRMRVYQGQAPDSEPDTESSTYQTTTMTYDGHGRLKTRHTPEQQVDPNNSSSTDHTAWDYSPDDTVQKVTDARGATVNFTLYNNRRLPLTVSYSVPSGSNIPVPPTVTLTYDEVGNRASMTETDASSNVVASHTYQYDTLARLRSETRHLPGLPNGYTIGYDYTLSGQLKTVTDPSGAIVNYNYDQSGSVGSVTGTNFGGTGTSNLATSIQYRAWGALKHLTYGNGLNLDLSYDSRLRATQQSLKVPGTPASGQVSRVNDYSYYDDGRMRFMSDEADHRFDRAYTFDHAGRLTQALTGYEARGEASGDLSPYNEAFQYDEWDNLTNRTTRNWSQQFGMGGPIAYTNGRRAGWTYDAEGNVTLEGNRYSSYDAAGMTTETSTGLTDVTQSYDGEGRRTKQVVTQRSSGPPPFTYTTTTTYDVRSTVLGGLVVESLDGSGAKTISYAYNPAGGLLATDNGQTAIYSTEDPQHTSEQTSWAGGRDAGRTEYDMVGADIGTNDFYQDQPQPDRDLPEHSGLMSEPADGCLADGMGDDCKYMALYAASGANIYFTYQRQASLTVDYDRQTGQAGYRRWISDSVEHATRIYDNMILNISYISSDGHWDFTPFDSNDALDQQRFSNDPYTDAYWKKWSEKYLKKFFECFPEIFVNYEGNKTGDNGKKKEMIWLKRYL